MNCLTCCRTKLERTPVFCAVDAGQFFQQEMLVVFHIGYYYLELVVGIVTGDQGTFHHFRHFGYRLIGSYSGVPGVLVRRYGCADQFKFSDGSHRTDRREQRHALLHYTAPIWIEGYCLQCHGAESASILSIPGATPVRYMKCLLVIAFRNRLNCFNRRHIALPSLTTDCPCRFKSLPFRIRTSHPFQAACCLAPIPFRVRQAQLANKLYFQCYFALWKRLLFRHRQPSPRIRRLLC